MENVIKASEFAKYLKKEGLVIVSKSELERLVGVKLNQRRKDLLRKPYLTLREILMLELLPVKSKTTLDRWIKSGRFLQKEVGVNDKNQTIIVTTALERLGYV